MAEKILFLVDGGRAARSAARDAIERLCPGWVVIETASGEEALTAVALDRPERVLVDANLAGLGGLETARRLRARCPGASVSLLSAYDREAMRAAAAEAGVGFMLKPVSDDDLRRFLEGGSPTP